MADTPKKATAPAKPERHAEDEPASKAHGQVDGELVEVNEHGDPVGDTDDWVAGGDELDRLREENARLREQLDEAGVRQQPRKPQQPSFGISEGTRNDLEMHGKAVDPFTGKTLTRDDLDGVDNTTRTPSGAEQ